MVMDFELEAWLMRVLSQGQEANNHCSEGRGLIRINIVRLESDTRKKQRRRFLCSASVA